MKRSNLPIWIVIGALSLLFVLPTLAMLAILISQGRFEFPMELFSGAEVEFGPGFLFATALILIPVALVVLVERSRRRTGDRRRTLGLTLGLLVALMLLLTLVPIISSLTGGLAAFPLRDISPILIFAALPLLVVVFAALVLLPGVLRRNGGGG